MGWILMECQPHGPSAVSCENGLLMGPTSGPGKAPTFAHQQPHIMEAYNHKVNHDSYKELGPPGSTWVLQYARTLQYIVLL